MSVLPAKVFTPDSVNTLVLEVSLTNTVLLATPPPMAPLRFCVALELNLNSGLLAAVVPKVIVPA